MKKRIIRTVLVGIVLLTACGKKEELPVEIPAKKIVSEQIVMREMSKTFSIGRYIGAKR
ncbi:Uncharacterised protein [Fusobacterium necrophorum subsp. necrophorum]|nr:Uncharacterised protein [Fusobacterium necrophorum subsp. necrophorum]